MPGKFQGEPASTEHFYTLALAGEQDETFVDSGDTQIDVFRIEREDYDTFPELVNEEFFILWEDDQGFVYHDTASSESDLIDSLETMGVPDDDINDMSI